MNTHKPIWTCTPIHIIIIYIHTFLQSYIYNCTVTKGVFKGGGGSGGSNPPPKFLDFFLKSEGKEIEIKIKKRDVGGGGRGYLLTYFWG